MKKIEQLFSTLTGLSLTILFIVTFGQVIQRYVFQMPMPWATDVIRIFFVYSVFFGMAVGLFKKSHLNIDVLLQVFPKKARPYFDMISNIVIFIFLSCLLRYSIPFMQANADQYTPYLMFPMSYVYAVIPVTVFCMLIFLIFDTFKIISGLLKHATQA
ncbi:MAG: TRAP transporter small permease [Aminobacterium sp.]|uniref:TRAP transporter small permease n=1 Tax=Aminobacterium sp. TaxID=1872491 RepID=UPI001BCED14A|nr:TRAP transporter small permease subunit [Aminobacterium sp.]MEA4876977.1 TRAP transporter small permease [Aminobacterium sp.]